MKHIHLLIQIPVLFTACTLVLSIFPWIQDTAAPPDDSLAYPETISLAFKLGRLVGNGAFTELSKVRTLLNCPECSSTRVLQLVQELEQLEDHSSTVNQVLGLMTFVNVLWFLALVGMTISFIPFFKIWIGPFIWVRVHRILNATQLFHPVLACLVSFGIVSSTHFYHMTTGSAEFVALTGCAFAMMGYVYFFTTRVNAYPVGEIMDVAKFRQLREESMQWHTVSELVAAISTALLAIRFESGILGFLTIALLYASIGFGVWSQPNIIFIGFFKLESVTRAIVVSAIVTVGMIVLNLFHLNAQPFTFGLHFFGAVVYFVGVLVSQHRMNGSYYYAIMAGSLAFGLLVGSVLGIATLYNTSIVFTFIETMDILGRMHIWEQKANVVAGLFVGSIVIYSVSLWMKEHPEWVSYVFM